MTDAPPTPKRPTRRWLTVKAAAIVLACLVPITGVVAYRYYTHPDRVRAMAEAFLQRQMRGRVRVAEARWTRLPNLRLYDVTIEEDPSFAAPADGDRFPALYCPEIRLELGLLSTFFGRPAVRSIQLVEPSAAIVHDAETGRFNVEGWLSNAASDVDWTRSNLPNVELRDTRLRLIDRNAEARRLVEDLEITLRARPRRDGPLGYDVTWQAGHGSALRGHARLDLTTGRVRNVSGGSPWITLESLLLVAQARLDSSADRRGQFDLTGRVRATHFDFGGAASQSGEQTIIAELADAAFAVALDAVERGVSPDRRYLRFDRVTGQVTFNAAGCSATLSGSLRGSACDVTAEVRAGPDGLADIENVRLRAEATIRHVVLPLNDPVGAPEQARFIACIPALARVYEQYDPHGPIDLGVTVTRDPGPDGSMTLENLRVDAHGIDFSAEHFPYRVRDVVGTIERSASGEMRCALRGTGVTGVVSVGGTFGRVAAPEEKQVTLSAKGLALDDAFWAALPARFDRVRRQFNPTGRVDLDVWLTPSGSIDPAEPKWQSSTVVNLLDVAATYDRFPYPLERLTGTIELDRAGVTVKGITGHAGPAAVDIDGSMVFDGRELNYLDMTVVGRGVPIDQRLRDALPEQARADLESFSPQGVFDSRTALTFDTRRRRIVHDTAVTLRGVAVRYERFPLALTDVTGALHVAESETRVKHLAARFRDAAIELDGVATRGPDGVSLEATVRATNVRLDEHTRRWLPPGLREQLGTWGVDGPIAMETRIAGGPDRAAPLVQHSRVLLDGVNVTHPRLPIPASDVRGELIVDGAGLRSARLGGRYDSAEVACTFDRSAGDDPASCGLTTLTATGLSFSDAVRGLLPPRLAGAWPRVTPTGRFTLELDEVGCRRPDERATPQFAVRGRARLMDAGVGHPGFIHGSSGTIEFAGLIYDEDGGTQLDGTLSLDRAEVFDHRIDLATGEWSFVCSRHGDGVLALRPLRAGIHGGNISGDVDLEFAPDRLAYRVTTAVRNMRLDSFLDAGAPPSADAAIAGSARGTVHGHLQVTGAAGGQSPPRGGGRFEIVDGRMYRLPLILGILHVLNLSAPAEEAFDEARADFLVVGDRIELTDIRLHGSVLGLFGGGVMTWPDRAVDLTLVNVDPQGWTRDVPLLADLIEGASKELMALHVTGRLSQPKVRLEPFRSIREEFQTLFKKKKPKQTQAVGS